MKLYTVRLNNNQDLRVELLRFAKQNSIQAGSILTCVGALKSFVLRMAGATPDKQDIRTFSGKHEIVSLVGTLSNNDCHLHIALSNKDGQVIGGHLKEGSLVDLTAEIVIAEDDAVIYTRELDNDTGFTELVVKQK
jgi:hypothetical protein